MMRAMPEIITTVRCDQCGKSDGVVHLCKMIRDKFSQDVRNEIEAALRDEFADIANTHPNPQP
jgi:hypothetical protein